MAKGLRPVRSFTLLYMLTNIHTSLYITCCPLLSRPVLSPSNSVFSTAVIHSHPKHGLKMNVIYRACKFWIKIEKFVHQIWTKQAENSIFWKPVFAHRRTVGQRAKLQARQSAERERRRINRLHHVVYTLAPLSNCYL